jgi:hypothetical protein
MIINDKQHLGHHQHYAQHRNQFLNSMNNNNNNNNNNKISSNDRFSSSFSPTSIYVYKPLNEDIFVEQQLDEKTIQFNLVKTPSKNLFTL